jgi:hypothetical protein
MSHKQQECIRSIDSDISCMITPALAQLLVATMLLSSLTCEAGESSAFCSGGADLCSKSGHCRREREAHGENGFLFLASFLGMLAHHLSDFNRISWHSP